MLISAMSRCLCIDGEEAPKMPPKGPVRDDRPGRPATDNPWRPSDGNGGGK